jgi:hypothetical protein
VIALVNHGHDLGHDRITTSCCHPDPLRTSVTLQLNKVRALLDATTKNKVTGSSLHQEINGLFAFMCALMGSFMSASLMLSTLVPRT